MKKTLVAVALVMMMAVSAQAAMVGVNLQNESTLRDTLGATDSAGLVPQLGWNNAGRYGASGLNDSTGASTAVSWTFQYSGGGNDNDDGQMVRDTNGSIADNDFKIMADAPYCTSGGTVWLLAGLDTVNGGTNRVIIYARNNTSMISATDGSYTTPTWVAFKDGYTADIAGWTSATMYMTPNGDWGNQWAGVQVVPEPATMSMLVLGGVATLIRRKQRA